MTDPTKPNIARSEFFHVRILKESEKEAVLEHLRATFFKDEPLSAFLQFEKNGAFKDFEDYCIKSIGEGQSLVAITDSGEIAGVSLNGPITKDDMDNSHYSNPEFKKILKLLDHVEEKINIFEKYPHIDRFFCLKILSVDGRWRGQGLAKQLVERTIEIAREQGFKLIRVDCTSHYSARAMTAFGFECVWEMKYEDYKPDGEVVFRPDSPHKAIKAFVLNI